MQEIVKGKEYLLDTTNKTNPKPVHIKFCHKDADKIFHDGVTSEEVIKMMIARHRWLAEKDPSVENIQTHLFLQQAYGAMTARKTIKLQNRAKNEHSGNGVSVQADGSKG